MNAAQIPHDRRLRAVHKANVPGASIRRLRLASLPLLLAACSVFPPGSPSPREMALRELASRQAQWAAAGIDDYVITLERQCFCPEARYEITVTGGIVTKVTHDGAPVPPAAVQGLPKTIPELFAVVAGVPSEAGIRVEYDADRGFPNQIQVDPIPNAIDDEYTIVVHGFTPTT